MEMVLPPYPRAPEQGLEPIETDALMIGAGPVGARTVIIAGGAGTFQPRRLRIAGADVLQGSAIHYKVNKSAAFHGKELVVLGGGDSALDWARASFAAFAHLHPKKKASLQYATTSRGLHRRLGWKVA